MSASESTEATFIIDTQNEPSLVIRILWFVFIGWWAVGAVSVIAYFVALTIIGLPLSFWLMNRIPVAATLKKSRQRLIVTTGNDGAPTLVVDRPVQRPWWQRTLWYLLVGWWATAVWLALAWLLCISILGLPLAFWMYGATGKVLTLKR